MRTLFTLTLAIFLLGLATPSGARSSARKSKKIKKNQNLNRCRHEVLPGETLAQVSRRYRISVKRLCEINSLKGSDVKAGKVLGIVSRYPCPVRRKVTYTVKQGDTLVKVAREHKMDLSLLRSLNPGQRGRLRPGQALMVIVEGPDPADQAGGLIPLHSGPGYAVRNAKRSWGTFLTINTLMDVFSAHRQQHPGASDLRVDDLSKRGGGHLSPHVSHRSGRDVDIRYPLTVATDEYVNATAANLDVPRTWDLIHQFLKTGKVTYVFVDYRLQRLLCEHARQQKVSQDLLDRYFQYPRGRGSSRGIIRHEPGHANHIHVRIIKPSKDKPTS